MGTMFDEIDKFTPDQGYNLVSIDEYEKPGERLTLVSKHGSRGEAESAMSSLKKGYPEGSFAVYGPRSEMPDTDPADDEEARQYRVANGMAP